MHVPKRLVQYRRAAADVDDDEVFQPIERHQILDPKIERMSTSKQELDINAAVILNRLQISHEDTEHANPGIAFLWSDEISRRNQMGNTVSWHGSDATPVDQSAEGFFEDF